MNLHVPQTEEARTEATQLMAVQNNLVSPRNGNPIIAAIQDFITASFLMSRKDNFYDRKTFAQICSYMVDADVQIDIPPPAILKPKMLWTGKQIFNVLMRPNKSLPVKLNFECRTKSYRKPGGGVAPDLCAQDGYLVVRNSEVMCGVFDKETIGAKGKKTLFYVTMRDYGAQEAADAMCRLSKLSARWLTNFGFSVGINDVQAAGNLMERKDQLIDKAYQDVEDIISNYKNGNLEAQAGCDEDTTLENKISGTLNKVREEAGHICVDELPKSNAPLIMATSGSKGSFINVSQMVACVGQQIISNKRIPDGFQDRSLPHFEKKSKNAPAKGFVRNSFYTGLTPSEFLFHAVSGREGLVDTAVKTAETGYMSRRLIKSLEDLSCQYDMTVRDAAGNLVQFKFGNDGLDPTNLEGDDSPVDFLRTWTHIQNLIDGKEDTALLPQQIIPLLSSLLEEYKFVNTCSEEFAESTTHFFQQLVDKLLRVRKSFGISDDEDTMDIDAPDPSSIALDNIIKVTEPQMQAFLLLLIEKYHKAKLEYGTAVGALGAQSIGEPGTQMTLKTFHFAGVASMNITLGVPRIKEIISAAKSISTPIINAKLENDTDLRVARIVKARLEKCVLEDVCPTDISTNVDHYVH
jgi:DNA-directed RNA polymerase III subunit RPC1